MLNKKCYGEIFDIQHFSVGDGPGIRTTVFLKGCPLRCIWCHNPESQNADEEYFASGEKIGRTVTAQEVLDEVIQDRILYETSTGGVTVSGGEPLAQPEFTAEILRLCRENKIHTAIETSGFAKENVFLNVVQNVDLVLFDIKETNEEKHLQFTGGSNAIILKNLARLENSRIPYIIRLPIIPGYNDRREHFANIRELTMRLAYCEDVQIMPYHKLGEYKYKQLGRQYACASIMEPTKQQVEMWKSWL